MNKDIYDKLTLFKDKVFSYKDLVNKKLTDIDRPSEFIDVKRMNDELLDLFYELKDVIYSEWGLQYKELHNEYQWNLGNVYDVALSNYYKYHISDSLEIAYRDLKEILIKNNNLININGTNPIESFKTSVLEDNNLSSNKDIQDIISDATEKFLDSESSKQDKRNAIKWLADCLEFYREAIKNTDFIKEDESDLFNIANNFWIRHFNKKQKIDYDDEVFYEWIFHSYYNTLKLYLRLVTRDRDTD